MCGSGHSGCILITSDALSECRSSRLKTLKVYYIFVPFSKWKATAILYMLLWFALAWFYAMTLRRTDRNFLHICREVLKVVHDAAFCSFCTPNTDSYRGHVAESTTHRIYNHILRLVSFNDWSFAGILHAWASSLLLSAVQDFPRLILKSVVRNVEESLCCTYNVTKSIVLYLPDSFPLRFENVDQLHIDYLWSIC